MDAKVVLITGASSGIGEATAYLFAQKDYKVAVHGTIQENIDKVVAECNKLSPSKHQHIGIRLDFSDAKNGAEAVKQTVSHFGRLDVLINNAGIFLHTRHQSSDAFDNYKKLLAINTESAVAASLEAAKYLKKTKGTIVMVSSIAAIRPRAGSFAYCMSKAAMSMFAKNLAIELAPWSVRVNTISPGPVKTAISRNWSPEDIAAAVARYAKGSVSLAGRIGRSDEVAKAVYFIASDDAEFVNGQELIVDGGSLIHDGSLIKRPQDDDDNE